MSKQDRPRDVLRGLALAGLVSGLYVLGSKLGLAFVSQPEGIAAIWPPSGLLLASLLLTGVRRWRFVVPAVFASIVLVNASSGNSLLLSLGFAVANCAESMAASWLLLRILGRPPRLDQLRDVLVFVVGAVIVSNAATGLIAAGLIRLGTGGAFWGIWRLWWVEDGTGMLIVAPVILSAARFDRTAWSPRRWMEAVALLALLLVSSFWVFDSKESVANLVFRFPHLLIPILLALSLRLGTIGAAVGALAVASAAVWGGFRGTGPFGVYVSRYPGEAVLAAQIFLAAASATSLVVAALYAERLRAEQSLRENGALLDGLVQGTTDAVYVKDLRGRYQLFNAAAVAITGKSPRDVLGRDDTALFPPAEAREVMGRDHALMEAGETRTYEEIVTTSDGLRRTFLSTKGPLRDDTGAVTGLFGIARDVTDRKVAEAELEHSHQLMRYVIEHARGAIAVHDRELRYVYVSDRYLQEFRIAEQDIIGRYHYDVFPDLPQPWRDVHRRALAGETSNAEEDVYQRPDGSFDWIRWECRPWYEGGGAIGGIIVYTEVITDRVKARQDLLASEARFRSVFDAAPLAIAVSRDGHQVFANAAYAELFRYARPADVSGAPIIDQIAPDARAEIVDRNRLRETGQPVVSHYETTGLKQDGSTFPLHVDVGAIHLPDGPATLAFLSDLSDREKADRDRAALEVQLRQAQKMEAIGTLAGGIAHDFNNILTPVMAHAELALMELDEPDAVREDLTQLLSSAERARALVSQILAISRKEEGEAATPIGLGTLVHETTKFLRASLPATIAIETAIDPACGAVLGNLSQMHQVLLNLCTNAGYAMRDGGGTLTVSVGRERRGQAGQEDTWIRLTVRDTGTGIPQEIIGRIFEPYFTTKPVGKGSGLGLAVVHAIVTRFGGTIDVNSTPGTGTTFDVWLPEARGAEELAEPRPTQVLPGHGEHVLVVDDDQAVRTVLRRTLVALGYRVTEAAGGPEALEAFRADVRGFDAVVTDHTMPGMTGLSLLVELLKLRPGLPVVLATGFSEGVNADVAQAAGARALLTKPYDRRNLSIVLRDALS